MSTDFVTLISFLTILLSSPEAFYTSNLYLGWLGKCFIKRKVIKNPELLPGFEPKNTYYTASQYATEKTELLFQDGARIFKKVTPVVFTDFNL